MAVVIYNKQVIASDMPCISPHDRGFTLGHGLFETILVNKGFIPLLKYHWRRLEASAPIISLKVPFSYQELESMIKTLLVENNLEDTIAGARVTITHGESERGLLPLITPHPNFLITVFECPTISNSPYSALIVNTRKNEHSAISRIKSISYLDNILAKQEAMNLQYDEAILLNTASNVADGSISNIYMVKDGKIFTPTIADGALPGVVRSILLEEFSKRFPIVEKSLSPEELMKADEVFLTNALIGVKSVNRINTQEYSSFSLADAIRKALNGVNL